MVQISILHGYCSMVIGPHQKPNLVGVVSGKILTQLIPTLAFIFCDNETWFENVI